MTFKISTTTALQANQILRQSTLVLMSIIMTKWGVSMYLIGVYEAFMFVSYTVSFFWITAFLQGILTQYPSLSESEKPSYVFNIFLIFNALSIFIFLILYFFSAQSLFVLTAKTDTQYFNVFTFYLLFFLPPYLLESVWTVENRPLSILGFSVLTNGLLVVSIVYPILQNRDFFGCFYIMVLVAFLRYIVLIFNVIKRGNFHFSPKIIRAFLGITTPLMGYAFVGGFIAAFTTWLVSWHYVNNLEMFAVYRFGSREFPVINALATGLSSAMIPLLIPQNNTVLDLKNDSNLPFETVNTEGVLILKEKTLRQWHILFPLSIVLMFSSKMLFGLVFNVEMEKAAPVFNVFLLLMLSRALFPQSIMMSLKETKMLFRMSIIEALSIVVMGYLFILIFGMVGVAWAMVLGYLLEKIMMIYFLRKKYNIRFEDYTHVHYYLFYSVALLASYVVSAW
jgi:Polysaccharide biosynthesis C-terminal domain